MGSRPLLHVLKATNFSLKTSGKKVDVLFFFNLFYLFIYLFFPIELFNGVLVQRPVTT